MEDQFKALGDALKKAESVTVFPGAGISAESGVPIPYSNFPGVTLHRKAGKIVPHFVEDWH